MSGPVEAINGSSLELCPCTSIRLADLAAFNAEHRFNLDPYSLAVYGCLIELHYKWERNAKYEVIIDRFDKAHSRIGCALGYARSDAAEDLMHNVFSVHPGKSARA